MTVNIASLGLTLSDMQTFGFDGQAAVSMFGPQATQLFIAQNLGVSATTAQQFNTTDIFNFITRAETAGAYNAGTNASVMQLLSQIDADLRNSTGAGLNNLQYSIAPDGTVNTSLDGVAGANYTTNINDLLSDALSQSQMGMVA